MIKYYSVFYLSLITLFFPSVGPFTDIDTQPIFIVLSCSSCALIMAKVNFENKIIILFFASTAMLLMKFLTESELLTLKYVATYSVSLLTFLTIYLIVYNKMIVLNVKFVIFVTLVYSVVGIVQFFVPDFLSFLVSRSVDAAFSFAESGRGVRSLTGEPAVLGKIFTMLNVIVVYLIFKDSKKYSLLHVYLATVIFFALNLTISRSAYSVGIHFFLILVLLSIVNFRMFIILILCSLFGFTLLLSLAKYFEGLRLAVVFSMLLENPQELLKQGAMRRVMNIPISINNLNYFGILGAGNSPEEYYARVITPFGLLDYIAFNRNIGGFIEYVLKFGIFSIPIMAILITFLVRTLSIKMLFNNRSYNIGFFLALAVLCLTYQDSTPAFPLSWFFVLYFPVDYYHHLLTKVEKI